MMINDKHKKRVIEDEERHLEYEAQPQLDCCNDDDGDSNEAGDSDDDADGASAKESIVAAEQNQVGSIG